MKSIQSYSLTSTCLSCTFVQPPSLASFVLTESALTRYSKGVHTVAVGPMPQIATINAANR